jgi:hypothetical protein
MKKNCSLNAHKLCIYRRPTFSYKFPWVFYYATKSTPESMLQKRCITLILPAPKYRRRAEGQVVNELKGGVYVRKLERKIILCD